MAPWRLTSSRIDSHIGARADHPLPFPSRPVLWPILGWGLPVTGHEHPGPHLPPGLPALCGQSRNDGRRAGADWGRRGPEEKGGNKSFRCSMPRLSGPDVFFKLDPPPPGDPQGGTPNVALWVPHQSRGKDHFWPFFFGGRCRYFFGPKMTPGKWVPQTPPPAGTLWVGGGGPALKNLIGSGFLRNELVEFG